MQNYPSYEQVAALTKLAIQARIDNWLGEGFGSWRWWVLVMLLIFPWVIWAKLVDKKQLHELTLFGMIVMVYSITLDELGFMLGLWNYPLDVIPVFPRLTSIDYTVVPIIFMLIYQCFPTWKSFFWALVTVAAVFAFVVEPIIVYLRFYIIIKWLYLYSFIIYIVMGLISKWMTRLLVDITRKNN
jgi:hypothetical protein